MQDVFESFESLPLIRTFQRRTHLNAPKLSSHSFRVKTIFSNERYAELEIFRQQMEQSKAGIHHQPYTNCKKHVLLYKFIFFSFSFFFAFLGLTTFHLHAYASMLPFISSTVIKGTITLFCTLLSLLSFTFACFLSTEQEAVHLTIRKTKRNLSAIYARKQLRLGLKRFFVFGPQRRQFYALKQMYQEALEKTNDKKEETFHLLTRISTAQGLNKNEKEILFNQAIEELNDKLMTLTRTFRHAPLSELHQ